MATQQQHQQHQLLVLLVLVLCCPGAAEGAMFNAPTPFPLANTDVMFEPTLRSGCYAELPLTYTSPACTNTKFTVVVTTGGSRIPALKKVLASYAPVKLVDKIILVWNNPDMPVNETLSQDKLEIVRSPSRSLNNRFLPIYNITTCAILNTDDDLELTHPGDIAFLFRAWQSHPTSILGPFARNAGRSYSSDYSRVTAHHHEALNSYNVILTNLAFLHRFWFFAYSCMLRQQAWDVVEQLQNGEDITMNFMVSAVTGLPPHQVVVEKDIVNYGRFDGISSGSSHMSKRNRCFMALFHIFGGRDYFISNYGVVTRAKCQGWGWCTGQPTAVLDLMPNGTLIRTG